MADDEQAKGLTVNIPGITDFVGSIWAKILALLTAISIVLGIALEVQAFITGYYVLRKTASEAKAASFQPDLIAAQVEKAQFDAKTASFQPDTASAQLDKAKNDAKASAFLPDSASAQLDKTKLEADAATYLPRKSRAEADTAQVNATWAKQMGKYP